MKTQKDKVTLKIPRPLYDNLSEVIRESGFNSVTEFVVYVLRTSSHPERSRRNRVLQRMRSKP